MSEQEQTNAKASPEGLIDNQPIVHGEKFIIIGAGASGLAAAIFFVREWNAQVTIFDSLLDLNQKPEESYPIGVNARGLQVLNHINAETRKEIERSPGMVTGWSVKSKLREVAFMDSGCVAGTTRGKVVSALFEEATRIEGIRIHLGHKLTTVDLANQRLTFTRVAEAEAEPLAVDFSDSRIIDASGCWSKIRAAMAEADPTFTVEAYPWRTTFRNLFTKHDVVVPKGIDPKAHHIFSTANVYASELLDGQWVFVVATSEDNASHEWLRSNDASEENVRRLKELIYKHAPIAKTMLTDDEEFACFFRRRAFGGQVVRCSRLNYAEKIVLLGDSAHSVIPATGEGINSALEDVWILMDCARKVDRSAWFDTYNNTRIQDVRALGEYAAWLVEGLRARPAERNTRTATTIVTSILKRVGVAGPTIADQCYGRFSHEKRRYSEIVSNWKEQQNKYRPIANVLMFIPNLFASENSTIELPGK
jgi:kynurenine 3-monooxygenase